MLMKRVHDNLHDGIIALPSFPVVFVTVGTNIMVAGAFHFYSFNPPSVMVGIKPEKYTYGLIIDKMEFGINIPTKKQLDKIDSCIIEECAVNLECQVVHQINFEGSHSWFIGEIKEVHIDENYTRDDALMFWLGQFRTVGKIIEGAGNDE